MSLWFYETCVLEKYYIVKNFKSGKKKLSEAEFGEFSFGFENIFLFISDHTTIIYIKYSISLSGNLLVL